MAQTSIKAAQFSGVVGNGESGYVLQSSGNGDMSWIANITPPAVTSLSYPGSATAADPAGGQTVTLTGTGFASGATVTVGGTTAPAVSFVSATTLTIITPVKAAGDYDVVVTNTDTGSATFINGISYNGIPAWTTAAGSLGTFASAQTISTITLQATEPDAGTITFNITNGALPTGLSLTGANIDGTTSLETAETLYTFTVTATDDESQTTPRVFTITVQKQFKSVDNFTINTYTGNGSTLAVEGKIGTAASFNGSSSKIVTSNIGAKTGDISISAWVYFDSVSGEQPIVCRDLTTTTRRFQFRLSGGKVNSYWFYSGGLSALESNSTLTTGQWYHIVSVWEEGVSNKIYINGSLDATNTTSLGTRSELEYITIGYLEQGNTYLNGKLDQVRIFDKALSSSEVTTLYGESNTSTTKSTTDIFDDGSGVALYEFEEGAKDTGGVSGYIGNGGMFNGSSSYILLNKINSTYFTPTAYAVSAWFKTSSNNISIFSTDAGGNPISSRTRIHINSNGYIEYEPFTISNKITSSITVNDNNWHFVAVSTDSSGNTALYVDNQSPVTGTGGSINFRSETWIGCTDTAVYSTITRNNFFNGKIDQVRIFSKAISSSEVTTLNNETAASTTKSTTDIFDDGSGVALYELEGNANDSGIDYGTDAIDSGQSAVFNGSNGVIDLGSNLGLANNSFSFSFWVANKKTTNSYFIGGGSQANNQGLHQIYLL